MDTAQPTTKQCPFCAETIQAAAIVCRYCGRDVQAGTPVTAPAPAIRQATATGPRCSNCKSEVALGALGCPNCGARFSNVPQPRQATERKVSPLAFGAFVIAGIVLLCVFLNVTGLGLKLLQAPRSPAAPAVPDSIDAFVMCKQFVTDRLKSPATAVFPTYGDDGTQTDKLSSVQFRAKAFVDSQNGFGANVRTRYTCTVSNTGGNNWHLDDLTTDP